MSEAITKKCRILLVVAFYPPEINSSAQIYRDLSVNFAEHGYEIDVLTSYPRTYAQLNTEDMHVPLEECIDNVHIHRVKHFATRDSKLLRGLEHFYIPFYYARELLRMKRNGSEFDVAIIYIAPLPLCYLGRFITTVCHIPVILNIEEYHPQELTDVGFIKNKFAISLLKHIERSACKHAQYITVHSPGGVQYLAQRGADTSHMSVAFNSIDPKVIDNTAIKADFKIKYGLSDKFLVSYGGLLSPFQGLSSILDVANAMKDEFPDVTFVIAGDGMIKDDLQKKIDTEQIFNLKIIPFMPREEYINFIKSSDISIVALDSRMKSPVLPGKLAYLMGLKKPIVGIVNPECETANIIREANAGIVVDQTDIAGFKFAICRLKDDSTLREQFGESGRKYMMKNMTSEVVVNTYEDVFQKMLGKNT